MKEAAEHIRESVLSHTPVIIRHHADADGISGGLLLEKACKALIPEKKKIDLFISRKPTSTPFYDVTDALRDISAIRRNQKGEPLLILVDFGSTADDFRALRIVRPFVKEIIIIDHHPPTIIDGRCEADEIALYHINPYLFDMDKNLTAGIQCYEMAKMIAGDADAMLAGVSAIGDKSNMKEYIDGSSMSKEDFMILALCVDFIGYTFRNDPATELIDEVVSSKEICKQIYEGLAIEQKVKTMADRAKVIDGKKALAIIDLNGINYRFPPPGKLTGLIFEKLQKGYPDLMVLGIFENSIIIRMNRPFLPVGEIIARLKKDFPNFEISGGGHDVAGSISVSAKDVMTLLSRISSYIE